MTIFLPVAGIGVNLFVLVGAGGVVGFLSGLLGVGGGFLLTPPLIFIGIPPTIAAASDSCQIVSASASGVAAHFRFGNVDYSEKSYLIVAGDYFNLNARLAYHFTLIDACLTDTPSANYVSFRFAGGGAIRARRNLRACFIEACLTDLGFQVDRRADLVNAWLKNLEPAVLAERLDILGRLTACTCQLDTYLDSRDTTEWYARQFREGNYSFEPPEEARVERAGEAARE